MTCDPPESVSSTTVTQQGDNLFSDVALACVGSVVPDDPISHNIAFIRAGQMFQQGLLLGFERTGLVPSLVLSVLPIQSFPEARRLWIRTERTRLSDKIIVDLLSFLNFTPLKQITIGMGVVIELLRWGWRLRHVPHRVVYTFNLSVPPGLFTLFGARLIGAKAVVSLNDINIPGHTIPSTLASRLDLWLHRWLIPRFDGHVAVADRIMRDFAPGRPYIRIEGGIWPQVLSQTDSALRRKKKDGSFVIVAAGSLDEANGILVLLEAFSVLEGEQYRLRIAGSGLLEHRVREAAAQDPRIEYVGYVSFEQVLDLYNSADVLINMRLTKAMNTKYFYPSKVMEYLASGVPVISTCTGHTEEEFGGFCYLLKDERPRGLADLIQYISSLDLCERVEMGRKARTYMAANKTWDAQGRKVVKFICDAVLSTTDSVQRV
jgi:glycosyltransferase involved in cell wall biosynthesis